MTGIRTYLQSCCAAAVLTSFCAALLPEGKSRQAVSLIGGLVILLVVVMPLLGLDTDDLQREFQNAFISIEPIAGADDELEARIREDCETYILDKAASLGMKIQTEVTLDTEAAIPYPCSVIVAGSFSHEEQNALSEILAMELGIPLEQQEWNLD